MTQKELQLDALKIGAHRYRLSFAKCGHNGRRNMEQVICKLCGWKWLPRVPEPRACPRCKRHDWNFGEKSKASKD
jgi:rubrerythrin